MFGFKNHGDFRKFEIWSIIFENPKIKNMDTLKLSKIVISRLQKVLKDEIFLIF